MPVSSCCQRAMWRTDGDVLGPLRAMTCVNHLFNGYPNRLQDNGVVGSAVHGAPAAMRLGVRSSVAGPASTAAQFPLNGAPREADSLGNQFIAQSKPDVVLNLVTLCFGEGWHERFSFCLSN